jgi:hypothetical protein
MLVITCISSAAPNTSKAASRSMAPVRAKPRVAPTSTRLLAMHRQGVEGTARRWADACQSGADYRSSAAQCRRREVPTPMVCLAFFDGACSAHWDKLLQGMYAHAWDVSIRMD